MGLNHTTLFVEPYTGTIIRDWRLDSPWPQSHTQLTATLEENK